MSGELTSAAALEQTGTRLQPAPGCSCCLSGALLRASEISQSDRINPSGDLSCLRHLPPTDVVLLPCCCSLVRCTASAAVPYISAWDSVVCVHACMCTLSAYGAATQCRLPRYISSQPPSSNAMHTCHPNKR